MITQSILVEEITEQYLAEVDPKNPPAPEVLVQELMKATNDMIEVQNIARAKKNQLVHLKDPTFYQIARILLHLHSVARISGGKNADPDLIPLGMYSGEGDTEGIYITNEDEIRSKARAYHPGITKNEFAEVLLAMRDHAPIRKRCMDRDLIPVKNGLFNFATKELEPFTPEHIFVSKAAIKYNPDAKSPTFTMPDGQLWEFCAWLADTMAGDVIDEDDDDETVARKEANNEAMYVLIWEVISAILRPHVRWGKSAWFYSDTGNNGKGSIVEMMRNLLGGAYASIPIEDFGKEFLLEPLTRAQSILVDENNVGTFIDKAANLKAVITNDVISINRKFKTPIAYQFYGFMVQCLNEFPRIKDKSESFYRRQLFVPFTKCYTGAERKYIKNDYLAREEVLEFVLMTALHMEHYELSEPEPCREVLDAYKQFNDPVRAFWAEFEHVFVWDLLPYGFLYDLFKAWSGKVNPNGSVVGKQAFLDSLKALVKTSPTWEWGGVTRTAGRMNSPEFLIGEYELGPWLNPMAKGSNDPARRCLPRLRETERGLKRISPALHAVQKGDVS